MKFTLKAMVLYNQFVWFDFQRFNGDKLSVYMMKNKRTKENLFTLQEVICSRSIHPSKLHKPNRPPIRCL